MRKPLVILAALVALAPFAHASTVVGTGHILVGDGFGAALSIFGFQDVDGFTLDVSAIAAGTILSTSTVDNGGFGYDLQMQFWSADFDFLGGCFAIGTEQSCAVPARAKWVDVYAFYGVDLDVTVLAG